MQRIEIFDQTGNLLFVKEKSAVDKDNDNYKVVYIAVQNSFGELFITELSKEDPRKQYFQKYGLSAAGMVLHNESPENACKRVLKNELGLEKEAVFLGERKFQSNNVIRWGYFYAVQHEDNIKINQECAKKGQFIGHDVVENMLLQDPDIFTPSFVVFWDEFRESLS